MQRLDSKINTFYNEQLKMDEAVLTFLKRKEKKRWKVVCCRRQRGSSISTRYSSRNLGRLWRRGTGARDGQQLQTKIVE